MLDVWCAGKVERLAPAAPVPVLAESGEPVFTAGGAANTAVRLAAQGAETVLFAAVGGDPEGKRLLSVLEREKVNIRNVMVCPGRITARKLRYYDGKRPLMRADREEKTELSPSQEREILEAVLKMADQTGLMLLSDYGKGFLTETLLREVISAARRRGIPILVDPKGSDFLRYRGVTLIKPNRRELHDMTGLPVSSPGEAAAAAAALCRSAECDYVLATLDREGMVLTDRKGLLKAVESTAEKPAGVIGAGDAVLACLASELLKGKTPEEAVLPALHAAESAGLPGWNEPVSAAARLGKLPDAEGLSQLERGRRNGRRLGFTNGCFDILHAGHVACLREAAAMGDILAVGVNSDESVRRLKGEGRPVNPLEDRLAVLAALEFVDYVIPFEEDTPLKLIEKLLPDVLVKGGDYQVSEIVGADVVRNHGGMVKTVPLAEGRSTTAILARLLREDAEI